jgi:hypothetical protein
LFNGSSSTGEYLLFGISFISTFRPTIFALEDRQATKPKFRAVLCERPCEPLVSVCKKGNFARPWRVRAAYLGLPHA